MAEQKAHHKKQPHFRLELVGRCGRSKRLCYEAALGEYYSGKYSVQTKLSSAIMAIAAVIGIPSAASAQMWTPGAEMVGQSVQVNTNGTTNTLYFDQGGAARIMTPEGKAVPGRWSVANQQICLDVGSGSAECWPYSSPFQAGKAINLTSSCDIQSQWLPNGTNMPEQQRMPERG